MKRRKKLPNGVVQNKRQARVAGNCVNFQRWNDKLFIFYKMVLPEKDNTIGFRKKTRHEENSIWKFKPVDKGRGTSSEIDRKDEGASWLL